jgi:hypothetical protein
VITANHVPDHATVARFRVRHEAALGELFGQVLSLCADAGLVSVGVVAVDGSKFAASASDRSVRSYDQIAREIVEEAGRIDAAEDEEGVRSSVCEAEATGVMCQSGIRSPKWILRAVSAGVQERADLHFVSARSIAR